MSTDTNGAIKSKDSSKPSTDKYEISESQLGVWKVFFATQKGAPRVLLELKERYPLCIRLILDVYGLCPRLLYLQMLSGCWKGVELALEMRIENTLLTQVGNVVDRVTGSLPFIGL